MSDDLPIASGASPREILDQALLAKNGISISFSSVESLRSFRARCYKLIQRDRSEAKNETGDLGSDYDMLSFSIDRVESTKLHITPGIPGITLIEER